MKRLLKFFVFFVFGTTLILSSCKKEDEILDEITVNLPTETIEQEVVEGLVTVSGIIQGVVHDGSSAGVIDAVTVGYSSNGTTGSVSASSTGGFSITGLAPGDYILTFGKDGFSTVTANVTIPFYSGDEETVPEGDVWLVVRSVEPILYPLNASAKGFVYIEGYPAEGTTVQLDYTTPDMFQLAPSLYTTVVDEDGYFEFLDVPGTIALLKIPQSNFMGNIIEDYEEMYMLSSDAMTSLGIVELEADDSLPLDIVEFNTDMDGFDPKNNMEFTFNQNIDLEESSFMLYDIFNDAYIPITVMGSKALHTIVFVPDMELELENYYAFIYDVVSTSGLEASGDHVFFTISGISPVSSNIQAYAGDTGPFYDVPLNGPITITYTLDVDQESVDVNLWNEDTGEEMETNIEVESNTLSIYPVITLDGNTEYGIEVDVSSFYKNDSFSTGDFYFYTEYGELPQLEIAPAIEIAEEFYADDDTYNIPFEITCVEGADTYTVYARDDHNNPDWVLIGEGDVIVEDYWEGEKIITGTLELPDRFDYFADDGIQTPFSHGTIVSLKVIASNEIYTAPESVEVTIMDETPFIPSDFNFSDQLDEELDDEITSANNVMNPLSLDLFVTFEFDNGMYIDNMVEPSVVIYDLSDETATDAEVAFEWRIIDGGYVGVMMVTIDHGTDATGYDLVINGISDTSGNIQEDEAIYTLY